METVFEDGEYMSRTGDTSVLVRQQFAAFVLRICGWENRGKKMSKKMNKTQAKRAVYAILATECRLGDMFARHIDGKDALALQMALDEISDELMRKSRFDFAPSSPQEAFRAVVENNT